MKFKYILLALLPLLAGCGHRSDNEVIMDAHYDYQSLNMRYADVLAVIDTDDCAAITEAVRLVGVDYSLSFGQSLWASFCGDSHLVYSEGSPLHRALYFVQKDINLLAKHTQSLERRVLFNVPIYERINQLRRALCTAARIVQSQKAYTQESQFIESSRLQKAQLSESREQTALLQDMAYDHARRPQHVTVQEKNIYVINT